jgi:hypothetical protein
VLQLGLGRAQFGSPDRMRPHSDVPFTGGARLC